MPEPTIPRPEAPASVRSGQSHIFLGCIMLTFAIAALGVAYFAFHEFLIEHAFKCVIALIAIWYAVDFLMTKIKKKE